MATKTKHEMTTEIGTRAPVAHHFLRFVPDRDCSFVCIWSRALPGRQWIQALPLPVPFHVALVLGYLSAAFRQPQVCRWSLKVERMVLIGVVVQLSLIVPTSLFRTGSPLPNFTEIFRTPAMSINDPKSFKSKALGSSSTCVSFWGRSYYSCYR